MNVDDEIEGVEVAAEKVVGIEVGVGADSTIESVVCTGKGVDVANGRDSVVGIDAGISA